MRYRTHPQLNNMHRAPSSIDRQQAQSALPWVSEGDITVGIRNFNRTTSLEDAIKSVRNQSDQVRILIVDDGSEPDLSGFYSQLALRYEFDLVFHDENRGAAAAWNTLVEHVETAFLSILDSDDALKPTYFRTMISALNSNAGSSAVYAPLRKTSKRKLPAGCGLFRDVLRRGFMASSGGLLVEVGLLRQFFPITTRRTDATYLDYCEDDRVSFEIAKRACVVAVPTVLYQVGKGGDNTSSNRDLMRKGWVSFYIEYKEDFLAENLAGRLGLHLGRAVSEGGLLRSAEELNSIRSAVTHVSFPARFMIYSGLSIGILRTTLLRTIRRSRKMVLRHWEGVVGR